MVLYHRIIALSRKKDYELFKIPAGLRDLIISSLHKHYFLQKILFIKDVEEFKLF